MPIRRSAACWVLVCALLLGADVERARADSVSPRIRPVNGRIASLLARGRLESPTMAALVEALERSDLIVHVEERWWLRRGIIGETQLVTCAGGYRYVRISLDVRVTDEAAVALLGHELQHAWEIAQAPWVIDQDTLAALYRQIGHRSRHQFGVVRVDTRAGPDTARRVSVELRNVVREE